MKAVLPTAPAMAMRFFGGELLDRERHRGIVEADGHVDLVGIEPLARDRGADIGLVLMVGEHDLDRLAKHRAAGILDRHARGNDRAGTAEIGIEARLIVEENPYSDFVVGDLRAGGSARQTDDRER